jgi:hypothetical protein
MEMPEITLLEWQKRFGSERACAKALIKVRWPQGFGWYPLSAYYTAPI